MACVFPASQTIIVGGGLAGMSACNQTLELGGKTVCLDKSAFCGGNSTKATSGINGAGTKTQAAKGVADNTDIFLADTLKGGAKKPEIAKVLCANSGDDVDWLMEKFDLDLSLLARLGGHSQPRTHRGAERFPGMTITYALIQMCENCQKSGRSRIINKAKVVDVIMNDKCVVGALYEKGGKMEKEFGPVIFCSGGFGADFGSDSLLAVYRPDLLHLPTTNGEHCTGDGIAIAKAIGGACVDLQHVQVHPTGLVHMDDKDNRVKFLAAEALRGEGGILIDRDGNRFCNDLGTRDYVTMNMWTHDKGPYRLLLNESSYSNIAWHCKHYCGRRVMKHYESGSDIAKDMGIPAAQLQASFDTYNGYAKNSNDPWGKKFFNGVPLNVNQKFMCAVVTPVVHYTMGGLQINGKCQVLHASNGSTVPGLFSAGEATGGVHGRNRLGGSALLECVALGRVAGKAAMEMDGVAHSGAKDVTNHVTVPPTPSTIPPECANRANSKAVATIAAAPMIAAETGSAIKKGGEYTLDEVAKHKSAEDCWVVVNGEVLDVTAFLPDHPGGKMAIMAFAGRDATEEFNMVHEEGIVQKYAADTVIGKLKLSSKL